MALLRAQLEGADASLGEVAAADVARMILGLERAIARAAYVVLGESRRGAGRHRQAIASASRLRFVGVEEGSVVGLLALPEAEPSDAELPIPVPHLSQLAVDRILDMIHGSSDGTDTELADAVAQLAIELGIGDRNSSLTLAGDWINSDGGQPRPAIIDRRVRERMQQIASQLPPSSRDDTLVGVLVEADFEAGTARLRLPDGSAVAVKFSPDLADLIQEGLRSQTQAEGLVRYHPRTHQVIEVELRSLVRSTPFALDEGSFWRTESFAQLQESQGTTGHLDPRELALPDLTDRDRADFLAALANEA